MDLIIGGQGNDLLIGSEFDDNIIGLAGNDTLKGGDGNDVLAGNDNNDTLIGDRGSDIFEGGKGDDRMIWNNGDGSDLMDGGQGTDVVEVNGSNTQGDEFVLKASHGKAIFDRINLVPFTLTVDDAEKFEVNGGGGNDSFIVKDLAGTDVKSVTFSGGDGNDTFNARETAVSVVANGDAGHDWLIGGSANDTLRGGEGNDTLVGFRGSDTFEGGKGDDRMIWNNGDGSDLMNGGEGTDVVEVNGANAQGDEFVLQANHGKAIFDRINLVPFTLTVDDAEKFEVNGGGGNDSFIVKDLAGTDVKSVTFSGGDGNDTFNARETAVSVVANGDAGHDSLIGGSANDTLRGGEGDDTLVGFRGSDTFEGGKGNDRMIWNNGDGSDLMNGGEGTDVVEVNGANAQGDEFVLQANHGKAIFDRINLVPFTLTVDDAEKFEVNGGGGNDSFTVKNLSGTDVLLVSFSGGDGNDIFNASETAVSVVAKGEAGDDILIGGAGNDLLIGGDGSDILIGGGGNDTLIGGNGPTQFAFSTGGAFATTNSGVDTIQNFNAGSDKISLSLSTFGVLTSVAGNGFSAANEFAMVSSDAEAATSDAYIVYSMGTGNLFYNQNGSADGYGTGAQFAWIENHASISTTNFQITT